ncbi:MAG: F0F1 ATP synthase subunit gamma [Deltaproteobacteria bacterium]
MEAVEHLKQMIKSAEDLQSVARTMKSLAAVNIRQYEKAVEALLDYTRTIDLGLQIVLRSHPGREIIAKIAPRQVTACIIVGSDVGMCGHLNESITSHAVNEISRLEPSPHDLIVLVVGERVLGRVEDEGFEVTKHFAVPSSISGITPLVQDLLMELEELRSQRKLDRVMIFYSKHESKASSEPGTALLLPLDRKWLEALDRRNWPGRTLPTFTMDRDLLFSFLIRQYLFVGLYRAMAESLASENAARLVAMQGAERNIEDRLAELSATYHRERQTTITSELLEIVAGFEALRQTARTGASHDRKQRPVN